MDIKLYGAKATVYLEFDGDLQELARVLSRQLKIPEFDLDTDCDPPHDQFAWTDTLGFDIWLRKSTLLDGFSYELTVESYMDVHDRFNFDLFDMSPWLAKEITRLCEFRSSIG